MLSEFKFGQAQVVITPPIGTELVGYPERDHGCEGVHDDLFAKAWVFSDGSEHAAFAFLDLTGVDLIITRKVREIVAANTDIEPHQVHLNFSHTHSGPACLPGAKNSIARMYSTDDPELNDIMVRHIAGVIIAAFQSLRKGRIGFGRGELTGLGTNRRDPVGLMDAEVLVIRVEEGDGSLAGAIVKYACHPTVLPAGNYMVSRDYPGFFCDALQAVKGDMVQMSFAQGTCADASTRWTRRESTFREAERLGHMLAGETLKVLEGIETTYKAQVHCAVEEVVLPTRTFPSPEEADRLYREATEHLEKLKASQAPSGEVRSAYVAQFGAQVRADVARQEIPTSLTAEVGLITLGDLKIALLPGEVFARTGLNLQQALGENSVVFGYTNCSWGYILPPEEEAEGGYELGASLVTSKAEGQLREAVLNLASQNRLGG